MTQTDAAFAYHRKAAEANRKLHPEVLYLARQQFPADGAAVEPVIASQSLRSVKK